jgi:hypothetical protein
MASIICQGSAARISVQRNGYLEKHVSLVSAVDMRMRVSHFNRLLLASFSSSLKGGLSARRACSASDTKLLDGLCEPDLPVPFVVGNGGGMIGAVSANASPET